jgi:hypothetical protein
MLEVKPGFKPYGKSPSSPSDLLDGGSCETCNSKLVSLLGIQNHDEVIPCSGADPQTWSDTHQPERKDHPGIDLLSPIAILLLHRIMIHYFPKGTFTIQARSSNAICDTAVAVV